MTDSSSLNAKTALITGGAKRIGAEIARTLHAAGMNIAIHYRSSSDEAIALADDLNSSRSDSAVTLQLDLDDTARLPGLIDDVYQAGDDWTRSSTTPPPSTPPRSAVSAKRIGTTCSTAT